jgi:hypothetical protein
METTKEFSKARIGSVVMEACGACGLKTNTILLKSHGSTTKEYVGPRVLMNSDARCEFCTFLSMWIDQGHYDSSVNGKIGAAKVVENLDNGSEKLIAYIPFTEKDNLNKKLFDGTPFTVKHGMVILAKREGEICKLVRILEEGI